jgi:NAD(P)-dependent dehydrogenase (short-subunit alcohol dehydrogenase family)
MSADLRGQTAVVTGASRGLGFAIAKRLLDDGARVSLWDQDEAGLGAAADALGQPDRIHTAVADVASEALVDAARDSTLRRFGAVSILVNNAGVAGPHGATWELSLADWRRVIDINMTGVFLCSRAFAPTMLAADYGRIVNIASVAGKEASPSIVAYAASKAGVIGFTKTLGRELAGTNITVNCVTPAAIKTAIFDKWPSDYVAALLAKIPMGRFGKPNELAALVAWIASPDASFSTGATFDLSGGRSDY